MTEAIRVGIHDMSMATTHYSMDLSVLAAHNGTDVQKYYRGIGQQVMSVAARDEDIVTLGASAAAPIIAKHGKAGIRTVLLATETGIDQSKAAGIYIHSLLDLPTTARVLELKQACYSGTAALQFAASLVARDPSQRVLVIASDVAKYDLDSSGEATQGAGAVAMLVAANPALLEIEPSAGVYTEDIMDFWRPNYRTTAVLDGKYSMRAYLRAVEGAWADYREQGGSAFDEIDTVCYHQPFTKMAVKAQRHLAKLNHHPHEDAAEVLEPTFGYNRLVGNTYTASLYLGLLSLLDSRDDLAGRRIGICSYGSGAVAEFFTMLVQPGYQEHRRQAETQAAIDSREPLDYETYRDLHEWQVPSDGGEHTFEERSHSGFRLAGVAGHKRLYQLQ
ncbi:MAG: hydroxymethylglutaryl-CoA synthase [Arachnia propionica]|nr:MAG: hydroxymethylglutaryl-CoA synthase [Arachnia propionica]